MEAIILAGGEGTRLRPLVADRPKPMALIREHPFLYYILTQLIKNHFERVILSIGYKGNVIKDYFGSSFDGMSLEYAFEEKKLGTGGAVRLASNLCSKENIFVLNGDTLFDVDFASAILQLKTSSRAVIFSKWVNNASRYGTLTVEDEKIVSFEEKKKANSGLINGGIYFLKKDSLNTFPLNSYFSLENDFLISLAKRKQLNHIRGNGYFIDIGVPEDYIKATKELPKLDLFN